MSSYPEAPEGWTPVARRAVGPFTTHLTFRRPDGGTTVWSSRAHRKHASRLSRVAPETKRVWWAPERASWWIGILFAVGSSCFLVAPFPGFVELVGSGVDGMVFFAGSVFFTSAATLQCLETFNADRGPGGGLEWRIAAVNLAGCVAFGISAVGAYVVPATGDVVDLAVANAFTALGALCFLVGAVLLLPESATAASS